MFRRSLPVVALALACGAEAFAQQDAGPPAVLMMTRENFRPGKMSEHNKQIQGFYGLFDKAKISS